MRSIKHPQIQGVTVLLVSPRRAAHDREPPAINDRPKSTFARRIRAAKPPKNRYDIRDDVIPGLGLAIHPSGVHTFFLRHVVRGRIHAALAGKGAESKGGAGHADG